MQEEIALLHRQVRQLQRRLKRLRSETPDSAVREGIQQEHGDANHHEGLLQRLVADRDALQRLVSQQNVLRMQQQQLVDTPAPVDDLVRLDCRFDFNPRLTNPLTLSCNP